MYSIFFNLPLKDKVLRGTLHLLYLLLLGTLNQKITLQLYVQ